MSRHLHSYLCRHGTYLNTPEVSCVRRTMVVYRRRRCRRRRPPPPRPSTTQFVRDPRLEPSPYRGLPETVPVTESLHRKTSHGTRPGGGGGPHRTLPRGQSPQQNIARARRGDKKHNAQRNPAQHSTTPQHLSVAQSHNTRDAP